MFKVSQNRRGYWYAHTAGKQNEPIPGSFGSRDHAFVFALRAENEYIRQNSVSHAVYTAVCEELKAAQDIVCTLCDVIESKCEVK